MDAARRPLWPSDSDKGHELTSEVAWAECPVRCTMGARYKVRSHRVEGPGYSVMWKEPCPECGAVSQAPRLRRREVI